MRAIILFVALAACKGGADTGGDTDTDTDADSDTDSDADTDADADTDTDTDTDTDPGVDSGSPEDTAPGDSGLDTGSPLYAMTEGHYDVDGALSTATSDCFVAGYSYYNDQWARDSVYEGFRFNDDGGGAWSVDWLAYIENDALTGGYAGNEGTFTGSVTATGYYGCELYYGLSLDNTLTSDTTFDFAWHVEFTDNGVAGCDYLYDYYDFGVPCTVDVEGSMKRL